MNYLLPTNLCDKSILSVDVKQGDPILSHDLKIRVNTKGHVLHVFVNGAHIGKSIVQIRTSLPIFII